MKYYKQCYLFFLILSISLNINAQHFEAEYRQQTNYGVAKTTNSFSFVFDNNNSFYFAKNKGETFSQKEIKRVNNNELNYFKIDLIDKVIVYNQPIVNKMQYIKENLPMFSWKILNEYDEFNSLKVQKAITHFRGRDYVAWFSVDYKIPIGPWKFSGLPGLIVKVESLDNEVNFELTKIHRISEENFHLQTKKLNDIISINEQKEINWESYKQQYIKFLEKFLKNMRADGESGDEYNINLYLIEDIGWTSK